MSAVYLLALTPLSFFIFFIIIFLLNAYNNTIQTRKKKNYNAIKKRNKNDALQISTLLSHRKIMSTRRIKGQEKEDEINMVAEIKNAGLLVALPRQVGIESGMSGGTRVFFGYLTFLNEIFQKK